MTLKQRLRRLAKRRKEGEATSEVDTQAGGRVLMLSSILQLIISILNWIFGRKSESADDAKLREDAELADAIKRGDSETVAAIRERRKRYPNSTILLLLAVGLAFTGCDTFRTRKTIPLASGDAPYQLPAGNYIDSKGQLHTENTNRWSLSEQDLFNKSSPEVLKPKPTSRMPPEYVSWGITAVLFTACVFLLKKRLRRAQKEEES